METNISTFTPPAHKKTLPPQQYIFITYLGSKWLHHLTFKSPLLHWHHSAEFINQYDTAEPRTPPPSTDSGKQAWALQTMAAGSMSGEEERAGSRETLREGFSLRQIMTTQAILPCRCVGTTVTIGRGSLYRSRAF